MTSTTTNKELCLQSLQAEFKAFRIQNRVRTKVPVHLRREVLKALDSGFSSSQLRTALGVTKAQLLDWQGKKRTPTRKEGSRLASPPRVLEVVPSVAEAKEPPNGLRVSYESGRLVVELSF